MSTTLDSKFLKALPSGLTKQEKKARLEAFKHDLFKLWSYVLNESTKTCYRLSPDLAADLHHTLAGAYEEYCACTKGGSGIDYSPFPATCRLEEILSQAEVVEFDPKQTYHVVRTIW